MKIIEPKVELLEQTDGVSHVARCARVCYGNAVNKGETADIALYQGLKKHNHLSMFRHESVYAMIPNNVISGNYLADYKHCPYIDYRCDEQYFYVATNQNFMLDHKDDTITHMIADHYLTPKEFYNASEKSFNLMRYTFHIVTQISTSRELNRVSPNAIAERSTRYVDESSGVICRSYWLDKEFADDYNQHGNVSSKFGINGFIAGKYLYCCWNSFEDYRELLAVGLKRQDARGVLPLDTATECIYTYSIDEWRHIIALRTADNAHPNARIIANMIKDELIQLGYEFNK